MQVKLVFNLPEESSDYSDHINGPRALKVLRVFDERLRRDIKYGEWSEDYLKALEEIRQILHLELVEENLAIYE